MRRKVSKYNQAVKWLAKEGRMPPNRLSHSVYAAMRQNGYGWDDVAQKWVVVEFTMSRPE